MEEVGSPPARPATQYGPIMTLESKQLASLLERKLECLERLHALSQTQLEVIGAGQMSQLLSILSSKQQALAEFHIIEQSLKPFAGQDPDQRHWAEPADRESCAGLLTRCERLLHEIVQQEKQAETLLRKHRDEAASRLHGACDSSHARSAYALSDSRRAAHLDLSTDS